MNMIKIIIRNLLGLAVAIVLCPVAATAADTFEVLFSRDVEISSSYVILVDKWSQSELSKIGKKLCVKNFCLVWFFKDREQAIAGAAHFRQQDFFYEPMPGLIGIYSKNKVYDEIICYDPAGNC